MTKWRRRCRRAVWAVATVGALAWLATQAAGGRPVGIYGDRIGVSVRPVEFGGVFLGVGSGWPSRDWLSREHLCAPGDPHGLREGDLILAAGIGRMGRRWNGNTPIVVTWWGVLLPGWYCVLIAVAPAVEPVLRRASAEWRRHRRRQRDPWGEGRCPACGYDLRAGHDWCPECGLPVPEARRRGGGSGVDASAPSR